MELKKNMMQCYQQVIDHTLLQEETLEAIVPDACPDILRIVSVCGQICISEKQVVEDQIILSGQVDASVLYLPEEGDSLQKMAVRLPFTSQTPAQPLVPGDEIFVTPTLCKQDARILNPRKVLVRLELMLEIAGYQKNTLVLCCGVEDSAQQGIQEQMAQQDIQPLCHVQTKHFTFDETLSLQGQGELDEILSVRIYPNCTESKLIGNKLIFKGDSEVQIMYLSDQGQLELSRHQLPFSQIMEMDDLGEEGKSNVSLVLESFFLNPGYGRTMDLTIDLLAQAAVRREQQLSLLQDAYSISHHLTVEKDNHTLVTAAEEVVVSQPLRQIFETPMPVSVVEDSWVSAGKITQNREGNQLTFSCDLSISLLCRDESGTWNTLEFTHPISHSSECLPTIMSCCRCATPGELFANPAPGGVEIRLAPQFMYSLVETQALSAVASATLGEPRERNTSSVVLRLPQEQENLWDIAKQYGTTTCQIIQANQLSDQSLPTGRMLLIPSIR